MKKLFIILLFFSSGPAYAQKLSDYGFYKVRLIESDQIIQAEINPFSSEPGIKSDRLYYWYSSNGIHSSQGGYSGKLLNGWYNAYYLNKNLKEQGIFKKGLKDGIWKNWKEDGTLSLVTRWKKGLVVPDDSVPFWKKLPFIKKRTKSTPIDSIKKITK